MAEECATKTISPFSPSFRLIRFTDNSNSSPIHNNPFELDECDVFWPSEVYSDVSVEDESDSLNPNRNFVPEMKNPAGRSVTGGMSKIFRQSAPVNVPIWPREMRKPVGPVMEIREREEDEEEERLPPHLIVARSRAMSFSVFEGVGRTLKGRDLRRVRNAVFQKTGFLE